MKNIFRNVNTVDDLYLLMLFSVYNLMVFDIDLYGMQTKYVLLLALTLMTLFVAVAKDGFKLIGRQMASMDMILLCVGGISFFQIVWKLLVAPSSYMGYVKVLLLCMMYYLLRIREDGISRDMVLVFSVSSLLVSISVFVELFWGNETYLMDNLLLADGSLQSWLVLVITVNAVGYCIYGSRKYWYGCNAVLNFFLLFLVKNVISIILVGSMLLMIPLVYVPTKKLVRSSMQLFFVFSFLLCSMSLLTGYSGLFEGIVTYHLEVSVYVGVILALFFALFFIFWKKYVAPEGDEKTVFYELRDFLRGILLILMGLLVVFVFAAMRESAVIPIEVSEYLTEVIKQGIVGEKSFVETVAKELGIFAVVIVFLLYGLLAMAFASKRKPTVSKHQKLFRVVSSMFLVQVLFLTQGMGNISLYMIFLVPCLEGMGMFERRTEEKEINETNNSDSVLQRVGDTGDSIERPTEGIERN